MRSHSITLVDATVSHGVAEVFAGISLTVGAGSRIGVVGPNGVGKTTLLRLLAGLEEPERGRVRLSPPDLAVGYLPQELDARAGETLRGYLDRRTAASETRVASVAAELDLAERLEQPLETFSGGEAARARLAALLLARFDVYCLDEPTNDLDFDGLERLERFVERVRGSVVLVSHDRAFLDRTVDRIVELEEGTRRLREWPGGWSEYEAARDRARELQYRRHGEREERSREIKSLLQERRGQARAHGKGAGRRGTQALKSKVRQAERSLERLEGVEKPFEPWELRLELEPGARGGDLVVSLEQAVVERGGFRLGPLDLELHRGDRLAIAGRNGSGKSTLLGRADRRDAAGLRAPHARAGRSPGRARAERGTGSRSTSRWSRRSAARPRPRARSWPSSGSAPTTCCARPGLSLRASEPGPSLRCSRPRGSTASILDEPTNHLDLPAIEELEAALEGYPGTIVLVTHDRRLLEGFGATRRVEL